MQLSWILVCHARPLVRSVFQAAEALACVVSLAILLIRLVRQVLRLADVALAQFESMSNPSPIGFMMVEPVKLRATVKSCSAVQIEASANAVEPVRLAAEEQRCVEVRPTYAAERSVSVMETIIAVL